MAIRWQMAAHATAASTTKWSFLISPSPPTPKKCASAYPAAGRLHPGGYVNSSKSTTLSCRRPSSRLGHGRVSPTSGREASEAGRGEIPSRKPASRPRRLSALCSHF